MEPVPAPASPVEVETSTVSMGEPEQEPAVQLHTAVINDEKALIEQEEPNHMIQEETVQTLSEVKGNHLEAWEK